jgi:flap endonuclease-1
MGVTLTPIAIREAIAIADLRGRTVAIDGNGELYQFLALIRLPDGTPLRDPGGRITSHLSGLFYRTTRLLAEHAVKPAFVFDGVPPVLKAAEIEKRREVKQRFESEVAAARAAAYSKSTMTSRLTREMVGEARELLRLLGLPTVQAPSEGEAQAAHMAASGAVWAAVSKPQRRSSRHPPLPRASQARTRSCGRRARASRVPASSAGPQLSFNWWMD